jgi:hypothetical protein
VLPQGWRVGGRGDDEVGALSDVVGDAVEAVDPQGAHRAGVGLQFAVHEVVDDQWAVRGGEQPAQGDLADR